MLPKLGVSYSTRHASSRTISTVHSGQISKKVFRHDANHTARMRHGNDVVVTGPTQTP